MEGVLEKTHYERWGGLDIETVVQTRLRMPFDEEMCAVIKELEPEVASFHFGLPTPNLVDRLEKRGVDRN